MIGRGGRYKKWAVRLPESAPALPFLHTEADEHRVNDAIRTRVAFRRHNLAGDESPIGHAGVGTFGFDLVLCRNVLIYLDKTMLPAIVARLHASLAEGGWLITAASDPPLNELAPFDDPTDAESEDSGNRTSASQRPTEHDL